MKSITRRALLRGLAASAGGFALLPLMSRLTGAGPQIATRFVFIVEGNCFEPVTLLSDNARAAIDPTASQPIGANRWWYNLYQHKSPLIVDNTQFDKTPALGAIATNGLASQAAVLFGLSSKITGGGHSAAHGALSSSRSTGGSPGGPTIDALLGALPQVKQTTPYDVVRLGVNGDLSKRLEFGTCAYAKAKPAPLILQPTAAYNSLFGSVASAAGRDAFQHRGRLLDFAHADVKASLAAFSGNSAERAKLESYLASLEEVEGRQQRMIALQQQLAAVEPTTPDKNPLYMKDSTLDRFAAQLELATAALKGALTNVVVVGSGTGGDFDMLYPASMNPGVSRHNLHHGSAANASFLQTIHWVTGMQVQVIAKMAHDLASTPEPAGGGSMLDHTVIVYVGDNGEQHHSTASEFPILLLGGAALGLRTGGRTIVYPGMGQSGHRQLSNLWNTLGHVAQSPLDTFGTEGPTRVAPGPLAELYG